MSETPRISRPKSSLSVEGKCSIVSPALFVVVVVFAIGSWIDVNCIFSQLTFLMSVLPERYELPSFLALVIQCSNVVPLVYTLSRKCFTISNNRPIIYFIHATAAVSITVLAFVYDKVVIMSSGVALSVPLLVIMLILASVDCLSTVTFLPFMSLLPPVYLSAFFLGQSLSSIIPSLLTLVQGVSSRTAPHPSYSFRTIFCKSKFTKNETIIINEGKRFSSRVYFLLIAGVITLSLISFLIMNCVRSLKSHLGVSYVGINRDHPMTETNNRPCSSVPAAKGMRSKLKNCLVKIKTTMSNANKSTSFLLAMVFWVSFLSNGVLVQLMSFAAAPYGGLCIQLASNMYLLFQAATSIVMIWKRIQDRWIILAVTFLFTMVCVGIIVLATLPKFSQPLPVSQGTAIVIILFCVSGACGSLVKLSVCSELSKSGESHMFLCGVFIQVGSFLGTLSTFIPVSVFCVFS